MDIDGRRHLRPGHSIALAAIAAVTLAGCGGNNNPSSTSPPTTAAVTPSQTTPTAPALTAQTFSSPGVAFTFKYPSDFARRQDQLPPGFRGILGLDPVNFIDVRLVARSRLGTAHLRRVVDSIFKRANTDVKEVVTSKHSALEMIRYDVREDVNGGTTRSLLHFFAAGPSTWEIGCQFTAAGRARIMPACNEAVNSISVNSSG